MSRAWGRRGWAGTAALALLFAAGACIYNPKLADCKVKCGEGNSCPSGTECSNGFCRPSGAEGFCVCAPGEERACGGGQGECLPGVQRCGESKTWGTCLGEVKPTPELCDGKDNNCNGAIDDDPTDAPPCGRTQGVCSGKTQQCVVIGSGKGYPGDCADAEYGADFEAVETRCDGKDNDCDGYVDGRRPRRLVDLADTFELTPVTGGYVLAWSEVGAGPTSVKAQAYGPSLAPIGGRVTLGSAPGAVVLRAASSGGRAYFVWENVSDFSVRGGYLDVANPGAAGALGGLPRPDAVSSLKIGANPSGLVGVYKGSDGGLWVYEQPSDGGSHSVRLVIPPEPGFGYVDAVNISSSGTIVSLDGTKDIDPDAGTSTDFDLLFELDGGRAVNKYVASGAYLLDTPRGLNAVYSGYCHSTFIFTCNESYLIADFEPWNPSASRTSLRLVDNVPAAWKVISGASASVTSTDWTVAWLENQRVFVGTALVGARSLRWRPLDVSDGGTVDRVRIAAGADSGFHAVAFAPTSGAGAIEGTLICPP